MSTSSPNKSRVASYLRERFHDHKDFRKNIVCALTPHEVWLIIHALDPLQTPWINVEKITRAHMEKEVPV